MHKINSFYQYISWFHKYFPALYSFGIKIYDDDNNLFSVNLLIWIL